MNKFENRFAEIRRKMDEIGVDAIYINSAENHLWVSGFDNPDGHILLTKDSCYVYADSRYIEAAKAESNEFCTVTMNSPKMNEIASEKGIKVLGYENERLTCSAFESLKKDCSVSEYKPVGNMFTELRSYKTEDEIENIIAAQRIAEDAFDYLLKNIRYDMTEIEVAAELEYFMKKRGSLKPSFDTICVSGTASSRPHGVPRPVKLEKGFLTLDFGAVWNGYHSDMTRTIVIGKADEKMKKLYDTVLRAQLAAIEKIEPGFKNSEADKAARDIINVDYEGKFSHGLGHGVGLEIHEAPGLRSGMGETTLKPGQIVTVEPGIYIEGKYGCRIEDMVLVTESGKKNLTNCPKELIEI